MKRALILAIPIALALAAAGADPATAGFGFSVYGGFRVGGVHFDVGLHHHGPHASSGYYYRAGGPVHAPGRRCGSLCYRTAGVGYHHYGCPVVLAHFRAHRFAPPIFGAYGFHYDSRYRSYWDGGYGHHFDGRVYRWDRRHRSRYYGRDYGYRGYDRHYRGRSDRYDGRRWWDQDRGRQRYDDRYRNHDRGRRWQDDRRRGGRDDGWRERDRGRGRAQPRYPD